MHVSLGRAIWIGLITALGIAAGSIVARLGDTTPWRVVPWLLLAAFWVFLVRRHGGSRRR